MHSSSPLVVVWRVTTRCTMACAFCAYDVRLPRGRSSVEAEPVLRLAYRLSELAARTGRSVLLSLLGGEPFLWPHREHVAAVVNEGRGVRLALTTNGMALAQPRHLDWVSKNLAELTVSLDGDAPFHDQVRGRNGSFAQIHQALLELQNRKRRGEVRPLIRVNTILMRDNLAGFPAFCDELATWGVDEVTFNQLGGNDRPEFYPTHRLRPEDVERLTKTLPALRERVAARGLVIRGSPSYLERLRCTAHGIARPVDECHPGQALWFVDEQHRVAPCSFTAEGYGVALDTLRTVEDLEQLPARFSAARLQRRLAPCSDCHSTQVFEKFSQESER